MTLLCQQRLERRSRLNPKRRLYSKRCIPTTKDRRESAVTVLGYPATMDITHWHQDAAAKLVSGAVVNDSV